MKTPIAAITSLLFAFTVQAEDGASSGNGTGQAEYKSETWIAVASATKGNRTEETCHVVIIPKILISTHVRGGLNKQGEELFQNEEAMKIAKDEYPKEKGWRNHKASIHHAEEGNNAIVSGACIVQGRRIKAGG